MNCRVVEMKVINSTSATQRYGLPFTLSLRQMQSRSLIWVRLASA